jgi:hypothetical protein
MIEAFTHGTAAECWLSGASMFVLDGHSFVLCPGVRLIC